MKKLNNITLVCVDCKYYTEAILSLEKSSEFIEFSNILYFSDKVPDYINDKITHVLIDPITNKTEYSHFILTELVKHIDTEFCMIVQHDGWVINTNNWKDEFIA